jgi:oxygen-independent coproporphyrinogen III oxidase
LYIGGGTPSQLTVDQLRGVVDQVRESFDCRRLVETTIELNPEDVSPHLARALADLGVTRASLGVQSLSDRSLRLLGRQHRADAVHGSVDALRDAGIAMVNIDLIVAHPNQTEESLRADLSKVVEIGPDHVSCYAMTYESGTPFGRALEWKRLSRQPEDTEISFLRECVRALTRAGFVQYEISNFARPGKRSVHNRAYWKRLPYLGFGPSAVSFDGACRWQNPRSLEDWANVVSGHGAPPTRETLNTEQALLETLMLGLRRPEGLRWNRLLRRFPHIRRVDAHPRILELVRSGLLLVTDSTIRPTSRGIELADSLTLEVFGCLDSVD